MTVIYKDKTPEEEKRIKYSKIMLLDSFITSFLLFSFAFFSQITSTNSEHDVNGIIYVCAAVFLFLFFIELFEYLKYGVVFKSKTLYLIFFSVLLGVLLYFRFF